MEMDLYARSHAGPRLALAPGRPGARGGGRLGEHAPGIGVGGLAAAARGASAAGLLHAELAAGLRFAGAAAGSSTRNPRQWPRSARAGRGTATGTRPPRGRLRRPRTSQTRA